MRDLGTGTKDPWPRDLLVLVILALARLAVHLLTNGQYGFHRDELAFFDNGRFLAWGYVEYPPLTPVIGRLSRELFGASLVGLRFFAALAQSVAMILTGLIARELGGGRWVQAASAVAAAIAPMALIMGAMFQYISFDYLWWVLAASFLVLRLGRDEPRWWLGVGAAVGLGMMTKYTMAFFAAGLVAAVLLSPLRRDLASRWLWGGVGVSLLIFLPNLIWQIQHDFISLAFLTTIRARDVAIGRSDGYFPMQFLVSANPFTAPFWLGGLYLLLFNRRWARWRPLAWLYLVPFVLLWLAGGRFYYIAPAYPMLLAVGVVAWAGWLARRSPSAGRRGWGGTWAGLALGAAAGAALMLPIAPINSTLWEVQASLHDNFVEQTGWPELVAAVSAVYHDLPPTEQSRAGILTGNYGEAGALNLYRTEFDLPEAISPVNSYWLRGFGTPPPETVIVLGISEEVIASFFETCTVAGQIVNPYGLPTEEVRFHPEILLCRRPLRPWAEVWPNLRRFG